MFLSDITLFPLYLSSISQRKQRLASSTAISSEYPFSTSLKPLFLSDSKIVGIFTLCFSSSRIEADNSLGLFSLVTTTPLPPRYSSIEQAASLPCLTASTTVAGPVTQSPPANIPEILVELLLSVSTLLLSNSTSISPLLKLLSTFCPTAEITISTSIIKEESSTARGLLLPLLSKSPPSILT